MIQFIPLFISIPLIGFWLWMLVDLRNNPYLPEETKNRWFLALVLLNIFGAAWYYLVEYQPRNR